MKVKLKVNVPETFINNPSYSNVWLSPTWVQMSHELWLMAESWYHNLLLFFLRPSNLFYSVQFSFIPETPTNIWVLSSEWKIQSTFVLNSNDSAVVTVFISYWSQGLWQVNTIQTVSIYTRTHPYSLNIVQSPLSFETFHWLPCLILADSTIGTVHVQGSKTNYTLMISIKNDVSNTECYWWWHFEISFNVFWMQSDGVFDLLHIYIFDSLFLVLRDVQHASFNLVCYWPIGMMARINHLTHTDKNTCANGQQRAHETGRAKARDRQGGTQMHVHGCTHRPLDNTDLCSNTMAWQLVTAIAVTSKLCRPPALFSVCLYCKYTLQCLQQLSSVTATDGCCATTRCCSLVMTDKSLSVPVCMLLFMWLIRQAS